MSKRPRYLRASVWLTSLRELASQGLTDRAIAERLNQQYPDHHFTRWRVWYWRTREVESAPGGTLDDWPVSPQRAREVRRNQYQWRTGWTHLLPEHVLTPRQCDILSILRDHGPRTRKEIVESFGLTYRSLDRNGLCLIRALLDLGLVAHLPATWPRRYTLAGRALQQPKHRPSPALAALLELLPC